MERKKVQNKNTVTKPLKRRAGTRPVNTEAISLPFDLDSAGGLESVLGDTIRPKGTTHQFLLPS